MQHNTLEYNTLKFIPKQCNTTEDITTTCTTTKGTSAKEIEIQCNSMYETALQLVIPLDTS